MAEGLLELTTAMQRFTAYFGELGVRWGLASDTCRMHALLYLAAKPLTVSDLAHALSLSNTQAEAALEDLAKWGMASRASESAWSVAGEPWDLLFSALEERRRREVRPALDLLRQCREEMAADGRTPAAATERTARLLGLVEDLALIDLQTRRVEPRTLLRMVSFGGQLARLVERISPSTNGRKYE